MSDTGTATTEPDRRLDLVAVLVVLGVVNIATAFALDGWSSTGLLLGAAALAVAGARVRGFTWDDLALACDSAGRGVRLGGATAALVVAAVAIVAAIPLTRDFFEDERFADLDGGDVLFEAAVRIPFVTALGEELLFRSVLLAALLAVTTATRAVVASSAAFGLWHVLTTVGDLDGNQVTADLNVWESVLGVIGVVVVTGLAGAGFAFIRLRSDSVIAPWLTHTALNASAFVAGAVVAS